jgi:hypothetical protein
MKARILEQDDPEQYTGDPTARLRPADVEQAVRAVDPAAFFVLPRVLRRAIKQDRGLTGFALRVPHRKSYVIDAGPLLQIVDRPELNPNDGSAVSGRVVLLPIPSPQKLAETSAGDVLTHYWRLLFHGRVHAALDERKSTGELSPAVVRQRIRQIGPAEFDEIRLVLQQEDLLLPPRSDESIYAEFAAVHLELRRFAPSFLPRYFPALDDLAAVDAVLAQDVDAETLYRATRPQGVPRPVDRCDIDHLVDGPEEPGDGREPALPPEDPSETKYRLLMRKSQRPAALGNVVRAAIYRARAERCAPPQILTRVRSAIKMDVYRLIRRLQAALELDQSSPQAWQESLFALVRQTPRGIWTPEARLLYDLQKVCVDHEREIYTVDLVEWALSLGRRPIKRSLPNQRDVLMSKHLHSAAGRLAAVRLTDNQRQELAALIQQATEQIETRLRERLRPVIAAALDEVGFAPHNLPEVVAWKKLVEELLDQIVERGFLNMGALRDAISRNNLKLPDISQPADFLHGDQLLRADRRLAVVLDGVYHRGEFYLRWMQRLSALGFGTGAGRFLTRFAVVPFGGAYVALAGVRHLAELVVGGKETAGDAAMEQGAAALSEAAVEPHAHLTSMWLVVALGLFLMCLVNSPAFRQAAASFFKTSFRVLRAVVVEPIRWIIRSPLLQQILSSRLFVLLFRFVIKPLIWTAVAWVLLPLDVSNWRTSAGSAASLFLAVNLLLNSRLGRNIEEVVTDSIVQTWHRFGIRIITGLFWLVVDIFKRILETIERLMYAVDEWLRFKSGEGTVSLAVKAVLGLLWFFVAYVVRFSVNLLIEPQINPIKHFPVVTVSHKLLLPLIPSLAGVLELTLDKPLAWTVATTVITSIPGIFGFLVWELKENWRLYAANRRKNLAPALIGSHGETMARLLKPGFHSGTLPKRYAKLRRAERHARADGNWRAVRKHLRALHRVEVSVRRGVEREFLELFAQSRCWQPPLPVLEEIRLGASCVKIALSRQGDSGNSLRITLAVQSGWLVADVAGPGWSEQLLPHQRDVLATAMIGLYKSAGVDLVGQQVFAEAPVPWERWVETWQYDLAGQGHPHDLLPPVRVLPS